MATTCEINNKTPKINYPCNWEYKIIAQKNEDILKAVQDILKGKEYKLENSNKSKTGKYVSYNLQTLVANEDERKVYFEALKSQKNIKFVL